MGIQPHRANPGITRNRESRNVSAAEVAETRRRVEERNRFLQLVAAKVTGPSAREMPPLRCLVPGDKDNALMRKAVFLVTVPIAFGRFELTQSTHRLLTRHLGMTLNSISHWALCVIDRVLDRPSYSYDLMSDQLAPLNALGKNQFRVNEVTPDYIRTWTACYYVGETTKSHEVIQQLGERRPAMHALHTVYYDSRILLLDRLRRQLTSMHDTGKNFMAVNPRYNLVSNNCQTLVESLVRLLCDGTAISEPMLKQELEALSPKITSDLMVARLRSKLDAVNGDSDADTDAKADRAGVKEDADIIKALWQRMHR